MGCDIHLYVEKKSVDGQWICVAKDAYGGRNYNLFSILADVRNGRGFAGCKTGEGFNPISKPKGLPADVSAVVQEESDGWSGDGHSHSYLTLSEILGFDWTQTTQLQGWVSAEAFKSWDRWGREHGEAPKGYCGGVDGGRVVHITEDTMRELIRADDTESLAHHYCLVKWEMPYARCASEFWSETIPKLLRLGIPANVRIVFWFDN